MANNNAQVTHEAIHTGLSGLGNDEKWQDMLNFRSAQNRTTVVPHKFRWLDAPCAKLHTVAAGLKGHILAFGQHQCFGLIGGDNINAFHLWRLKSKFLGEHSDRSAQSQQLLVQGSYTGDAAVKLRVHYIKGRLTPFWDAPETTPTAPPETVPDFGCGPDNSDGGDSPRHFTLRLKIRNRDLTMEETIEYLRDVRVRVQRSGDDSETGLTNDQGLIVFKALREGYYNITFSKAGFYAGSARIQLTSSTEQTYSLTEKNPTYSTLGTEYKIGNFIRERYGPNDEQFVDEILSSGIMSTVGSLHVLFVNDHTVQVGEAYSMQDIDVDDRVIVYGWVYNPGPGWDVGCPIGDFYIRQGTIYQCISTHLKTNALTHPGTGGSWNSYWQVVRTMVSYDTAPYNPGGSYYVGNKVVHGANRYRCINEHLPVVEPIGTYPYNWDLLP